MSPPILPGIDVAVLRARFIAAGGAIFKHKGDDRWVAPGFKPVRMHAGRKDASRQLIRLVRLVEEKKYEYTRIVTSEPAEVPLVGAPPAAPRRRSLPGLDPPAPPLPAVVLDTEAVRAEAAKIDAARAGQDASRAEREKRGKWRQKFRKTDVILADIPMIGGHRVKVVLYGYDIVKPYLAHDEGVNELLKDGYELLVIGGDDFKEECTLKHIDGLIEEIAKIRGRCDCLPTAEWAPEYRAKFEAGDDKDRLGT